MDQLFSTGQVARLLGVPSYRIEYAHTNNGLGEPVQRVMNKRLYTLDDLRRVAKHFGVEPDESLLVPGNEEVV
jgi:DNA-binding transcriptional MerR regulator